MKETAGSTLAALSEGLAEAVERASQAVVTVDGRRQLAASGIVWGQGGVVVTADHALERDEDIRVTLPDGVTVAGAVVGRDPGSDIAVLRLAQQGAAAIGVMEAQDRPSGSKAQSVEREASPSVCELAPPESAKVGMLVLAVGRPGKGSPMASLGVISAVGGPWRTARGGRIEAYIRADVRLYPGFSGGPLVDVEGRVVGLNSWYLARGEDLAIPSPAVTRIVQTLLTEGRVRRAYLGVTSQPVGIPAALRESAGLEQETGLMVVGVEPGSPAEAGGLLLGDVLVGVAGEPVRDVPDLQASLSAGVVDRQTAVSVLRAGQCKELKVRPRERA